MFKFVTAFRLFSKEIISAYRPHNKVLNEIIIFKVQNRNVAQGPIIKPSEVYPQDLPGSERCLSSKAAEHGV